MILAGVLISSACVFVVGVEFLPSSSWGGGRVSWTSSWEEIMTWVVKCLEQLLPLELGRGGGWVTSIHWLFPHGEYAAGILLFDICLA